MRKVGFVSLFVLTKKASSFKIGASEVKRRLYVLNAEIIKSVLALVDEIPAGRVATYGQIARLIGRPKTPAWWGRFSVSRSFMAASILATG